MPTQLPELAKPLQAAGFKGQSGRPGQRDGTAAECRGACRWWHRLLRVLRRLAADQPPRGDGRDQYNSSPEHDLITGGFIANGRADERPANPDFRVLVTVGFDKVTDQVLAQARGKTGRAYFDAVDAASKQIVAECEKDGSVRCSVANMYYGTDFYRIAQLELSDVRLVYAPPRDRQLRRRDRQLHGRATPATSPCCAPTWARTASRPPQQGQRALPGTGAPADVGGRPEGRRLRDAGRLPGHHLPPPHRGRIRRPDRCRAAAPRVGVPADDRHHRAPPPGRAGAYPLCLAAAVAEEQPQARRWRTRPAAQRRQGPAPPTRPRCWPRPTATTRATSRRCWQTCRGAAVGERDLLLDQIAAQSQLLRSALLLGACASNRPSLTRSARAVTSSATRR